MSDDVIKNLKELRAKHEKETHSISEKLRILENIPKAKALEGKYFKCREGSIFPRNTPKWMYKRVVRAVNEHLIVDTFMVGYRYKFDVMFNETESVYRFDSPVFVEITKKQYLKMFNRMLRQIGTIGKRKDK
jgi:hypothetical protein